MNEKSKNLKNQDQGVGSGELVAALLREKALCDHTTAELWKTDMQGYGADDEIIGKYEGRSEAFEEAAKLIEKYCS